MKDREWASWYHQLTVDTSQWVGHDFEQTAGDSEELGSLACCSSWGCKESDIT